MTLAHEAGWAYVAGIFDGEGSITGNYATASLQIDVCMTELNPLEFCSQVTGCGQVDRGHEVRTNRRQPYHWRVSGQDDIVYVLQEMMPYLLVKKSQAMAYLVIAKLRAAKKNRYSPSVYPDAEKQAAQLIRTLKRTNPETAYEEALDLCIYLRGEIERRRTRQ